MRQRTNRPPNSNDTRRTTCPKRIDGDPHRTHWTGLSAGSGRGGLSRAVYWTATGIMLAESAVGGIYDLARQPPFYPILIDLGYPAYLATILGSAKVLAVFALVAPGMPRLKQWAYAGIMINMIGAIMSQLASGSSPTNVIAPASFAIITLISWQLHHPRH